MDITQSRTLQFRSVRENDDERHICPLQLDVIERAIDLWTNPGDLVLSPFAGIGSEGYVAIQAGRRFLGIRAEGGVFQVGVQKSRSGQGAARWAIRMTSITYLAQPYSHADSAIRQWRYESGRDAAIELIRRGLVVYSPIMYTHQLAAYGDLGLGWDEWKHFDEAFIRSCEQCIVLMLPGWHRSVGVAAEIAMFIEQGKTVEYLDWPLSEEAKT